MKVLVDQGGRIKVVKVGIPGIQGPPGADLPTGGGLDEFLVKNGSGDFAADWRPLEDADIPLSITRDNDLQAEATARASGDSALQAGVDAEATARAAADSAEAGARAAADTAEASARAAADLLLIPLTQKAAANGVATLGPDSRVPTSQMPPLAINETFPVVSQAAMLALSAQRGDVAVRTDLTPNRVFILTADDATVLANWIEITAAGAVVTVNGQSGAVVLGPADVGADPTGSAATVSAALLAHINDNLNAHMADSLGFAPAGSFVSDTVQEAIEEADAKKLGIDTISFIATLHGVSGTSGTDQYDAIQDLYDEVEAQSGPNKRMYVWFPEGDYGVTACPLVRGDNITVAGAGPGTRFYRMAIFNDSLLSNEGREDTAYSQRGLRFKNFLLDDRRDELGTSESPQACLALGHCVDVRVRGVYADQCYFHGIEINSSEDFGVSGCRVTNARSSSIQLDNAAGGGFAGLNADGTIIQLGYVRNNYLADQDDPTIAVMDRAGAIHIHKMPAKHIDVANNLIVNCANGVTCDNATGSSTTDVNEDITIRDNIMVGIVKDATETRTLNGYGVYCVPTKGLRISGNKMWGVQRRGIRCLGAGALRHTTVSVVDNDIEMDSGEHAIDVSKTDGAKIDRNNIWGTWKVTGTWAAIVCGEDVTKIRCRFNDGVGSGASNIKGIYVFSPSSLSASDVKVFGNSMDNFETCFVAMSQGAGVFSDIEMVNNTATRAVTDGFRFGPVVGGKFRDNTVVGSAVGPTRGFRIYRCTNVETGGNKVKGGGFITTGMVFESDASGVTSDVTSTSDAVLDCTTGIHLLQTSSGLSDVTLTTPRVSGCTTGIKLENAVLDSMVIGPRIKNCTDAMVWGSSVDRCTADNVQIINCTNGFTYTLKANTIGRILKDGVRVIPPNRDFKVMRTTGNLTLNSTTWTNMPGATTWEGSLAARVGDQVLIALSARQSSEGTYSFLDVATIVAGAVVNTLSGVAESGTNEGIPGWSGITGVASNVGGAVIYTIQTGDIDPATGLVKFRLRYRTLAASNKTFLADSNRPATFMGSVLSPV